MHSLRSLAHRNQKTNPKTIHDAVLLPTLTTGEDLEVPLPISQDARPSISRV